MENNIVEFLKELRESADEIHAIFMHGSCFRLYSMLSKLYPQAIPYWSDRDDHCITEIDGKFYDIGGEVSEKFIQQQSYYIVPEEFRKGYHLLKWKENKTYSVSVKVEKYI